MKINSQYSKGNDVTLINEDIITACKKLPNSICDLIITSPPYNVGKEYEEKLTLEDYLMWQKQVITILTNKLKKNGSICWQVGNYVNNGEVIPLDIYFYQIFKELGFKLRNRIVWHFNFGLHAQKRFSGRYETLLWFTKSDIYKFNLDPIRIPQLYPGKRHSSNHKNQGKPSGNPKGKNPSDFWEFDPISIVKEGYIWDIPNVKANHPEKTIHPCQFPVEVVERCLLSMTNKHDLIFDPFVGVGSTIIASVKNKRRCIGIDKDAKYIELTKKRIREFEQGVLKIRPLGKPIHLPDRKQKVATVPKEWEKKKYAKTQTKKEKESEKDSYSKRNREKTA